MAMGVRSLPVPLSSGSGKAVTVLTFGAFDDPLAGLVTPGVTVITMLAVSPAVPALTNGSSKSSEYGDT